MKDSNAVNANAIQSIRRNSAIAGVGGVGAGFFSAGEAGAAWGLAGFDLSFFIVVGSASKGPALQRGYSSRDWQCVCPSQNRLPLMVP